MCAAYSLFGPAVIVVNNHIIKGLGFPYPMTLSAIGLCTTATFCAVRIAGQVLQLGRRAAPARARGRRLALHMILVVDRVTVVGPFALVRGGRSERAGPTLHRGAAELCAKQRRGRGVEAVEEKRGACLDNCRW